MHLPQLPPISLDTWIGIFFGVLGIAVGYVLYRKSVERVDLRYLVDSNQPKVFDPMIPSDLEVLYRGQQLDRREAVYAVTVTLWNQGRRAVRRTEVLDDFAISIQGDARLLQVRVERQSRAVCDFRVTADNQSSPHSIPVTFFLMENGDGAKFTAIV